MRPKPALRTELLFYLSFLAAAALLVGVATTVVAGTIAPGEEFWMVMALVALEVGVFVVFGRHLVTRLVLRPLGQLTATADAVAAGDLDARAPDAETRDFATLAARLNRMTDHLLDARSQLVRSEKLASVGRLAAGIAHEVGNTLGAVGTYVEVLRRRGADPEVVAGLNRELDRIDHIVRSLLDYARPEEEPLDVVQPDEIVRGAFALLAAQGALKAVRASLDVAEGVPRVRARAYLLEQAIVNLVLNAVDAAPGAPVVVGARRWAYEPGRAAPRRATDAAPAFFSASWRGGRRPLSLPPVPSVRSCSSQTGDREWRVRTARRCSSRSTRRNRRGAAPGSGSPLWRAPSTRWEGSCGSTRRARGARRSSCFCPLRVRHEPGPDRRR